MNTSPDFAEDVIPVLTYPVALVHGMGGFDELRIAIGEYKALGWHYFHGVSEWLRRHAVPEVLSPELPPTGSIRDRAEALKAALDQYFPGRKVHLIAHSMGGLDARDYISRLGGHERVLSLTTLGTPHHGSPLAETICQKMIDPIATAGERFKWTGLLDRLNDRFAAHRDLTPESCEAFNAETPDCPDVTYYSYGGAPAPGEVQWPLRPFYEILKRRNGADDNDGLVPLESAKWTGWRGAVPADHLAFINWQFQEASREVFDVWTFYTGLLTDLSDAECSEDQ